MSALVTRKSILFVVLVAVFGIFLGLSSSTTVNAYDECEMFNECDPCEFNYCDPCEMFNECDPCEFNDCDPCEFNYCDPCKMFNECDPCKMFNECDPCEFNDCEEEPVVEVVVPRVPELCLTDGIQVTLEDNMLLIFSDFRDTTNGMIISQIPLRSLRAPSDEEKASGLPILAAYKESEFAPGWSVAIYWQNEHYAVVVYTDNGQTVYEDTGAICGWS